MCLGVPQHSPWKLMYEPFDMLTGVSILLSGTKVINKIRVWPSPMCNCVCVHFDQQNLTAHAAELILIQFFLDLR